MNKTKTSEEWIKLPVALLRDKNITITDAVIYAIMLDKAKTNPNLNIKIARSKIAQLAGCSLSTTIRSLEKLEKEGWIQSLSSEKGGEKLTYRLTPILPADKRSEKKELKELREKEELERLRKKEEDRKFLEPYKALANRFDMLNSDEQGGNQNGNIGNKG